MHSPDRPTRRLDPGQQERLIGSFGLRVASIGETPVDHDSSALDVTSGDDNGTTRYEARTAEEVSWRPEPRSSLPCPVSRRRMNRATPCVPGMPSPMPTRRLL